MFLNFLSRQTKNIDKKVINFEKIPNLLFVFGISTLVGACSVVKVTTPGTPENGNRATYQYYQETTNPFTGETSLSTISEQEATSGFNAYLEQKTMTPQEVKEIETRKLNRNREEFQRQRGNQERLEKLRQSAPRE